MAGSTRTLTVDIVGDTSKLGKGLKSAERDAQRFHGKVTGTIGVGLKSIVTGAAAAGLALAGAQGLTKAVGSVIDDWNAHNKVSGQTAAVLKSTGNAARVSQADIEGHADAIEKLSGMDDVAVQSGENMLLTFTNVKDTVANAGDQFGIFTRATNIMADMSVALGEQAPQAALQLGKALNDPVKGISALSRVGVTFDAQQKKLIGTYVKHGQTAKAQAVILKELQKEFGGSAKAAGQTLSGQINILKAHFFDFTGALLSRVMPVVLRFVQWLTVNLPHAIAVMSGAFAQLRSVATESIGVFEQHLPLLRRIAEIIAPIAVGILAITAALKLWSIATGVWAAATRIAAAVQLAFDAIIAANPIGLLVLAIAGLVAALTILYIRHKSVRDFIAGVWAYWGTKIVAIVKEVIRIVEEWGAKFIGVVRRTMAVILPVLRAGFEVIKTIIRIAAAVLQGHWAAAWAQIQKLPGQVLNLVVSGLRAYVTILARVGKAIGSGLYHGILGVLSGLGGALIGLVKGAINGAIGILNSGFNAVHDHWPDIPGAPGPPFGSNPIPTLALGGIVRRPTLALIGEAGPEMVVPLSGRNAGAGMNVTINSVPADADPRAIAAAISWQFRTLST